MLANLTSQIARKIQTRPATQFARILCDALLNIDTQIRIFKVLLHPRLKGLAQKYPAMFYKYATGRPGSLGLSAGQRAVCFHHHYVYLLTIAPAGLLDQMLNEGFGVFETNYDEKVLSVIAGLGDPCYNEGELGLDFRVDGVRIFNLSFTIVPGRMFGSSAENIILITRIQGARGSQSQNCFAAKALGDVTPPAFLFSILQGFADAFGIHEFAAVSATNQTCFAETFSWTFLKDYDDFLTSQGAALGPDGFFHCPVPAPAKPMEFVKRDKRVRTKKKRAYKRRIAEDVCQLFRKSLDGRIAQPERPAIMAQMPETSEA